MGAPLAGLSPQSGILPSPFLPNPGFGFQAPGSWLVQPSLLPQAAQPAGQQQSHRLNDQTSQQNQNSSLLSDNQDFDVERGRDSSQNVGGTEPLLQQDPSLESPNAGEGIGDSNNTIENQIQLQQPQHQQIQTSQISQPQNAPQGFMPIPTNLLMQYPQMFTNQLPTQPGPGLSEANAASFAARNGIVLPQFPTMAGNMMPTTFLPGQMGMQRPFLAPPTARSNGIPLALSCDEEQLSEYQILVRKQLEIFEATAEDVESNTQGRKKRVSLGQVGIRCLHCASYPLRQRGRGAVYYPAKLQGKSRWGGDEGVGGRVRCHSY
jgi:hypothetical protein